ncbi:MAG TPA: hypothetical protein PLL30_01680 [Candidatus Krumholzibacteria bacterium]|nr:hypothetical protein [Candidatus Krumholzibacteria bacterium]HPD70475.1 hypothetical protein [Candidatus Krumholzibacteria bacterium]HRY39825.1 hypothetical protein [Candidatus Krumholzibacteria bacterium]
MSRRRLSPRTIVRTIILVALTAPVLVEAGMLDSWLKKGEAKPIQAVRYELDPPLVFDAGSLALDPSGRWLVGASRLTLTDRSVISRDGRRLDRRDLRLGEDARIMGHRLADGTVAVKRLSLFTLRPAPAQFGVDAMDAAVVGELSPDAPN